MRYFPDDYGVKVGEHRVISKFSLRPRTLVDNSMVWLSSYLAYQVYTENSKGTFWKDEFWFIDGGTKEETEITANAIKIQLSKRFGKSELPRAVEVFTESLIKYKDKAFHKKVETIINGE